MTPKKNDWNICVYYGVIGLAVIYLMMILSFGMQPGYKFGDWYNDFQTIVIPELSASNYGLNDIRVYARLWTASTWKTIIMSILASSIVIIYMITLKRNYIFGKEYGTAKYIDPVAVNKILKDPDRNPEKRYEFSYVKQVDILFKRFYFNRKCIIVMNQRQLSEHIYMSLDTRHTHLNCNILLLGGSGAGKTYKFVKPQILQMSSSYIITDPKGEILRDCGEFLKKHGYHVIVINLLDTNGLRHSNHYNPFVYIHTETDVIKMVTNLISNTTPNGSTPNDPFWQKAETMLFTGLVFYIKEVEPPEKQNFRRLMELLAMSEFTEDNRGNKQQSQLDKLFAHLEMVETERIEKEQQEFKSGLRKLPPKPMSSAVQNYNSVMKGAADTVRSIIISAKARLSNLTTDEILTLLDDDEINIRELGLGYNEDKKTKTALFCVIPDNDKSYNFLIGMLYSQIFDELYHVADFECSGRLPIHVTFMLDEFANVALPDDYCSLLSTMRSREISSIIIIQNMAQIKALFEKTWETIPGNTDVFIYLGGNEQSTHEYVSKMLGKGTYAKKTTGVTKSHQGSSSQNEDVIGRELMLPDEVRKVDGTKCLVVIRGFNPIFDDKIQTDKHPLYNEINSIEYVHHPEKDRCHNRGIKFASKNSIKAALKRDENSESGAHSVITLSGEALMNMADEDIDEFFSTDNQKNSALEFTKYLDKIDIIQKSNEKIKQDESMVQTVKSLNYKYIKEQFNSDIVAVCLKLKKIGFEVEQIEAMYPLFQNSKYGLDDINEMLSINMNSTDIAAICNSLC